MTNPKMFVADLRAVLQEVRASLPDENVQDAFELFEHAEWGEALSLICTQLYEYDVAISQDLYDEIESLGQQMGMPPNEWRMVNYLVKPPS